MALAADEAIGLIRGYAAAGRIEFTRHGWDEMLNAGSTVRDVQHALAHGVSALGQDNGTWKTHGPDREGDDLTVVVAIQGGLLVITVW